MSLNYKFILKLTKLSSVFLLDSILKKCIPPL